MLGQVCCDSNGKLNAQSVLLEAGQEQGGRQVPVDLSELKEFSLFPGQVRYTYFLMHIFSFMFVFILLLSNIFILHIIFRNQNY